MIQPISLLVAAMLTCTTGSYYALPADDCEVWESDQNEIFIVEADEDAYSCFEELVNNQDDLDGVTGVPDVAEMCIGNVMTIACKEDLYTSTEAVFGFMNIINGEKAVALLMIDDIYYPLFTYVDDSDGVLIWFPFWSVEMIQNNGGTATLVTFVEGLY